MKIYHYPKCNSCRQALKFLRERDISVTAIDISQQPPTRQELRSMLKAYQGETRKLFNTSGLQYRELNLKETLPAMTDDDAMALLAGNGMLVKRPFLLADQGRNLVGFKQADWEAAL